MDFNALTGECFMGRRAQRACGKILLNLILKYGFPEVPWGSPGLFRFKGSLHG